MITTVRADHLRLGDRLLMPAFIGDGWGHRPEVVTRLELVGDDVIVNDNLTTSRPNHLYILERQP